MGLVPVQSFYLPFALAGLELLLGHAVAPLVVGIIAGHTYASRTSGIARSGLMRYNLFAAHVPVYAQLSLLSCASSANQWRPSLTRPQFHIIVMAPAH